MFWKHLPRTSLEAIIEASLNATREEPAPHREVVVGKVTSHQAYGNTAIPGARQRRRGRGREPALYEGHSIAGEKETKSISTTFIIDTEVGDALESATAS